MYIVIAGTPFKSSSVSLVIMVSRDVI